MCGLNKNYKKLCIIMSNPSVFFILTPYNMLNLGTLVFTLAQTIAQTEY